MREKIQNHRNEESATFTELEMIDEHRKGEGNTVEENEIAPEIELRLTC